VAQHCDISSHLLFALEDARWEWYGGRISLKISLKTRKNCFAAVGFSADEEGGGAMIRLLSAAATHVGLVRINNEDAYLSMPETGLFALSDGMGGEAAGEIASRYFIDTAQACSIGEVPDSAGEKYARVEEIFGQSNKRILVHAAHNLDDWGMGCTADVLMFYNDRYVVGHVGDSRVYLLRHGGLSQLTSDHSLVQLQVDKGLLTPQEAKKHPRKNIILKALGTDASVSPDILEGEALEHDVFLLCSDGLTDMVEDSEIQRILLAEGSLQQKTADLIGAALDAGGRDNVTVVLCQVEMSSEQTRALGSRSR
jgi:serine/threonine protein phosphatase PrpC